jgi:hypothetical protein
MRTLALQQAHPVLLERLALGYIAGDADHPGHVAGRIAHDAASSFDPPDRSIGEQDAVLMLVIGAGGYRVLDPLHDRRAIFGVDEITEGSEGSVEAPGFQPEDRLERLVPRDRSARHLPRPGAEPACFERETGMCLEQPLLDIHVSLMRLVRPPLRKAAAGMGDERRLVLGHACERVVDVGRRHR